ncbi:MAG: LacI family DNA-binding transcriptional regulator [Spirochaetales bacterium]|nr:LacI family DNA-binding transcriptional regulator [Spirochaetales bacterium]
MSAQITDVAKLAGVSISTVSRVISNNGYPVKPAVREKVLAAAKELNYVPNISAKTLRQQKRNGIALIVRSISDPYFNNIERGVTEAAFKNGLIASVFTSMQDTEFEMKYYSVILEQQYAGVIIGGGAYGGSKTNKRLKNIVRQLQNQGCKVIALAPQGFDVPTISVDNEDVGFKATKQLISLGHSQIAYIGGYPDHLVDVGRFNGYQKALQEAGIDYNPLIVKMSEYSIQGGYDNCKALLEQKGEFSAVYCSNDHIAYGVKQCLRDNGIRVPKDISIMGTGGFYDDVGFFFDANLSTIKFPFYSLGERAVNMIVSDEKLENDYKEIMATEVILKKTTAKKG